MTGKVTLKQVAEAAGVAESTASRALSGNGQFAPDTKQKILDAATQLGYRVSSRSSPWKNTDKPRRGVIGVVVAALHNSFYPYLVDRLHNDLDDCGFDIVLIIDEITHDRASRKLLSLIDMLDGVIIATAMIGSPTVEYLHELGVPTVLAIRSNMRSNVHVVESDNFSAGVEAMEHLVSLGHRQIGFLMGPSNTSTTKGRLSGALSVLDSANIEIDPKDILFTEFTHEAGYSGCVQLLRRKKLLSAIFCANDVIAIGVLDAAKKLGRKVPDDLSIVGVDDIPMANWSMISLTTVRQPIGEIGAMAVKRIVESIRSGQTNAAPSHHIFPTGLIKRTTTGPNKLA